MTDFSNPTYSAARYHLMKYMPETILKGDPLALENAFVQKILQNTTHADITTPEGEFLSYWNIGVDDWKNVFGQKIVNYFENVASLCQTQQGYNEIVKLAEYRRFLFKKSHQFEFDLTFAENNITEDVFPLKMLKNGNVMTIKK